MAVLATLGLNSAALLLVAAALIRFLRSRCSGEGTQFRRLAGLGCALAGGVCLALAGRYPGVEDFFRQRKALAEPLALLREPPGRFLLGVHGPDPLQVRADACTLSFNWVTPQGESFTSRVTGTDLADLGEAPTGREYAIAWDVLAEGATDAEGRRAAASLGRNFGNWHLMVSFRIELLVAAGVDARLPESLTLLSERLGRMELFRSDPTTTLWTTKDDDLFGVYPPVAWPFEQLAVRQMSLVSPYHASLRALAGWLAPGFLLASLGLLLLVPAPARTVTGSARPRLFPLSRGGAAAFPTRSRKRSDLLMTLAALLLAGITTWFGEKIPVGDGLGWDGWKYGSWVMEPYQSLIEQGVSPYNVGRALPALAVHLSLQALAVPLIPENVIRGFEVWNVILIALSAWVWARLADRLGLGERGKWLGFMGLFLNFAVLKFASYYPVLTDYFAFALSLLMLDSYVRGHRATLYLLTAAGAFTWPTLLPQGGLFLCFPRGHSPRKNPPPVGHRLGRVLALAAALAVLAFVSTFIRYDHAFAYKREAPDLFTGRGVLALAALLVGVYVFLSLRGLWDWDRLFDLPALLRHYARPLAAGVLFVLGLKCFVLWAARQPANPGEGEGELIDLLAGGSVRWPGVFLVAHVAYFGPILWLALFQWRAVCRQAHALGMGLTLAITFGMLFSLDGESRHLIAFFPLLVLSAVAACVRRPGRTPPLWLFALLSLAVSKVWLPIKASAEQLGDWTSWGQFPDQFYFMNQGPWMSWRSYLIQAVAVAAAGLLLFGAVRWQQRGAGAGPHRPRQPAEPAGQKQTAMVSEKRAHGTR